MGTFVVKMDDAEINALTIEADKRNLTRGEYVAGLLRKIKPKDEYEQKIIEHQDAISELCEGARVGNDVFYKWQASTNVKDHKPLLNILIEVYESLGTLLIKYKEEKKRLLDAQMNIKLLAKKEENKNMYAEAAQIAIQSSKLKQS